MRMFKIFGMFRVVRICHSTPEFALAPMFKLKKILHLLSVLKTTFVTMPTLFLRFTLPNTQFFNSVTDLVHCRPSEKYFPGIGWHHQPCTRQTRRIMLISSSIKHRKGRRKQKKSSPTWKKISRYSEKKNQEFLSSVTHSWQAFKKPWLKNWKKSEYLLYFVHKRMWGDRLFANQSPTDKVNLGLLGVNWCLVTVHFTDHQTGLE